MAPAFDPATDIPDLSGKVVLVTGGNIGLGLATIDALAAHGPASIYLCARRRGAAEEAAASIREKHGEKANIHVLALDLTSLESVKQCAAAFDAQSERLDLLFLNAGVAGVSPAVTKEGYETTFGINHMGHALLTQLLLPKLRATGRSHPDADPRIIVVSSTAAKSYGPRTLLLDQMRTDGAAIPNMTRYQHSKLANILFARRLAQLYPDVTSVSLHPGLVQTDIFRKADDPGMSGLMRTAIGLAYRFFGSTSVEGAKTQLWAATAKKGKGGVENGKHYFPVGKEVTFANAEDQKLTDELWEYTTKELASYGGPGWMSS